MRKVEYVRSLIQRFWGPQARVRTLARPVEDEQVQRRLADVDLIVVATDNHYSRLVAQEVALRYLRPVLCLGTVIVKRADEESPRIYSRITLPPLHGGWCLACANVISLEQASIERADAHLREEIMQRGYLDGVPAPAVYWVNTNCATTAAGVVHGIAADFVDADNGIDWILDLVRGQRLHVEHDVEPSCYFCTPGGLVATGQA
jgi:hypothetical protein